MCRRCCRGHRRSLVVVRQGFPSHPGVGLGWGGPPPPPKKKKGGGGGGAGGATHGRQVVGAGAPPPPRFFFFCGGGGGPPTPTPLPGGRGTSAGLRPDCDGDPDSNAYTLCTPLSPCFLIHSLSLLSPPLQGQRSSCSGEEGESLPHEGYGGGTTTRRMVATTTGATTTRRTTTRRMLATTTGRSPRCRRHHPPREEAEESTLAVTYTCLFVISHAG